MPKMHSRFWSDYTSESFASLPRERLIAVLPVGAVEQHGPHMPMSTDHATIDAVVSATAPLLPAELPVLFLPTLPYGKSNEHARYPGTLTLSAHTLIDLWMDIGDSVARSGVRKLVLFNSHGGQMSVMDIVAAARQAAVAWPDDALHFEYFAAPVSDAGDGSGEPFKLRLARRGIDVPVSADQTAVEALHEFGIDVPTSCEQGVCGTCVVPLVGADAEHRDYCLTQADRRHQVALCCSRAKGDVLEIEL